MTVITKQVRHESEAAYIVPSGLRRGGLLTSNLVPEGIELVRTSSEPAPLA